MSTTSLATARNKKKKQDKNKQPHQPAIGLFRILPVFSLSVFLLIYFLKLHVSI
jgi:hypothetical protein